MNNCIIWIPGLDDYFMHQNIIKKYIPVLENFSIIPIQVNDYNMNTKYPYSTSDFKFHIHKMEAIIKQNIRKYNGKKYLYAHSTGYVLALFLLKYTNLSKEFNGLILNDPFTDFKKSIGLNFLEKNIYLYPLSWKFTNYGWRFNKYGIIKNGGKSTYREHLRKIPHIDKETKKLFPNITPPVYAGYLFASTKAQKEIHDIDKKEPYLNNFPVLLFISNGDKMWSELTSKNTKDADKISNNVTQVIINNTYHDIFFTDDPNNYPKINIALYNFFNNNYKSNSNIKLFQLSPFEIHDKLLSFPNFLSIILLFLIIIIFIKFFIKK